MKKILPHKLAHFLLLAFMLPSLACGSSTNPTAVSPANIHPTVALINTNTAVIPSPTVIQPTTEPTNTALPPTEVVVASIVPSDTAIVPTATLPAAIGNLVVDFIDVGQGDATLIVTPEGKVALLDGGDQGSGVLQYLQAKGITRIDLVIASHPHADHIGGLVDVLGAIPVERVITNGQPHTTGIYESFIDAIAASRADYIEVKRGDVIPLGSVSFLVLNPATVVGDDLQNGSLVLQLAYGDKVFLFEGDAEEPAEMSMIASGIPLKADVLKVGHHGSHSSSSPAFLNTVRPSVAIYSAGAGNSYGHPHQETLAALAAVGAQVYGTDLNQTISVVVDNADLTVDPDTAGPRAPPIVVLPTTLPVATEQPVVQPTGTAQAAENGILALEITSVTSPVQPGANATLTVRTLPGVSCDITVYYKSGPSQAAELIMQNADNAGNVSWTWKVGARTTQGDWRIVVSAKSNGQTVTKEIYFTVTN